MRRYVRKLFHKIVQNPSHNLKIFALLIQRSIRVHEKLIVFYFLAEVGYKVMQVMIEVYARCLLDYLQSLRDKLQSH